MSNNLTDLPALNSVIKNHKILTREEEKELIKRAQEGDVLSRQKIINHNLRFVILERNKILDIKSTNKATLDECFSLGIIALHKAIDGYKDKGARFATYAKWHIKAVIVKFLAEDGTIKTPQSSTNKMRKVMREMEKDNMRLTAKNIAMGKCDEAIKKHGANKRGVLALLKAKKSNVTSMQQAIFDDSTDRSDITTIETEKVEIPDCGDKEIIRKCLNEALSELNDREAIILILRYGFNGGPGMTLDRVAKIFGLTRERIRQIQRDTLIKMRRKHIADLLY